MTIMEAIKQLECLKDYQLRTKDPAAPDIAENDAKAIDMAINALKKWSINEFNRKE